MKTVAAVTLLVVSLGLAACGDNMYQPVSQSYPSGSTNFAYSAYYPGTPNGMVFSPTAPGTAPAPVAAPSGPTPGVPAGAQTFDALADRASWENCGNVGCSGGQTDASGGYQYEGSGVHFRLNNTNFSDILWWKGLGHHQNATHMIYDFVAMSPNPQMAQAFEFDGNQQIETGPGNTHTTTVFGTQCGFRNSKQWDYWAGEGRGWAPTGVPCPEWQPNQLMHIVWEFERTPDNRAHFVAITVNGQRYALQNVYGGAPRVSGAHYGPDTIAVQIDGRGQPGTADVYLLSAQVSFW